jgi:sugar transferase (PEP-CTERM system associated)
MIRFPSLSARGLALRSVLFDTGFAVLVALLALVLGIGGSGEAFPKAGTQVASFAACLLVLNGASGLYGRPAAESFGRSLWRALLVIALVLPLTYFIFERLPASTTHVTTIQVSVMAGAVALILRRAFVSHFTSGEVPRSRILVFGTGPAALAVSETLRTSEPDIDIVGFVAGPNETTAAVPFDKVLPLQSTLLALANELRISEIVVALTERRAGSMPLRQLLDCKASGIRVHDLNTHFEKTLGQIRIDYLNAGWLIFGDGFNQGAWRSLVKRTFDVFCSILLLLVSAPVMLLAALVVRLESPGPIFYRQERTGQGGKPFSVIKFRSMRNDAERDGRPVWASANDARVTRFGAVMRKLRIDELPQLFNVLRGDMSLVGPRPERPFFVEQLTQEIPFYALRHSIKPGVTGWAQVRYPYGATVEDSLQKLQYDLYYVKNHTLLVDLVVLMETVGVVLTGKGAR